MESDLDFFPDYLNGYQFDDGEGEEVEEEEIKYHYIEILDAPRELLPPVELTLKDLSHIANELGLIKLCWPEIEHPEFENRVNFPESYLANSNKEKLLLLYTENFRRQFSYKYPHRKQLFLASNNECGMQKMVCNTIRLTTLPYPEIETWQDCAKFVGNALRFEPFEIPTLIPNRFYSPHTTFVRKSGQPHELACVLCSLLIGLGYDAYVVFGYAVRDITLRIMSRVDSPYPPDEKQEDVRDEGEDNKKYTVKPPRDLRSKFLLMMEQKKIDQIKAEQEREAELERQREEEEERPPPDDLEGMRFHFWVLIRTEGRAIDENTFVEPSTGYAHPVNSPLYSGIESVWNHLNYWVNMQDCKEGLGTIDYNLHDVEKWEHLLIGEPTQWRVTVENLNMDDEEAALAKIMEEKHLDMPISWSMKISIPHKALKQKYPEGMISTWYKKTLVEEYAPYIQYDGLLTKIMRYKDFDCTECITVEQIYENRQDKLKKIVYDLKSDLVTEYFGPGREDAVIEHTYSNKDTDSNKRIIKFNHKARYDGLEKIEFEREHMVEYYIDRDDLFYFREVFYARKGQPPPGFTESHRKLILRIIEKYERNHKVPASHDIATREFAIVDRQILLKYHFGEGRVTCSTRNFNKPSIAESGEGMKFTPELTWGYVAEIGAKPPTQLELFLLFQKMLKEEEKSLSRIREIEDQVAEFLTLRDHEMAFPKLDVSLFNIEQNEEYRQGMLEKEKQEQEYKEREIEDAGVEYLTPYLTLLGNPESVTPVEAFKIKEKCLSDFKQLLLNRAICIQKQFEHWTQYLKDRQQWYNINQDTVTEEDEIKYFQEVNDLTFLLQCYEIRLARHRDLSFFRYEAVVRYLNAQLKPLIETFG
ncbi:dynein regulatory complex subunit 7 [Tribolium castaneum]|uniref:dynein regulatory complex subunit 7 n=1 Tax=Tribolium castaneum TaxID=7070 RepID=UPI00046BFD15|nr:PREDICTED: dynein regulatory complex subunit 7 isoform X1 [Tribolium castaneum]|eukprot:XP_008199980.1 PREDICTED: dynein regulatory complex subunit 7 isoform X1 [Tribolium castaneum]